MPTAVNGQLYYSQDEVQAGLPQYHAALRQATGYTGQFSADPTQRFQQYITGATPEQQAAYSALSSAQGSGAFTPGSTTVVQPNQNLSSIQTGITGLGTGQQGLMTGQQNLQTGITDLGTGQQNLQTGITGLGTGQQNLQTGITGLGTGQQGLMTGQENIQTGITDLGIGQQGILGGQQALGAGQGAIQGVIGAPGEGQPQTLFSGQAGLMGGQQALGQQLTGGIQDITGAVGGVSQNIDALERAAQQYQREAQRQRSQIQTAGLTGREQIARQVADVGQQVNTGVEQQRSLMGGMAAPVAAMGATAGIQPGGATQAATQYAQTQKFAPPAQGQQTIMGPMGPMTIDPRDQVTRPISSSGLMNYPV
jgi:putative membrane protein